MQSGSRIRNQKDFAAGVIYIVAGAAFAIGALNYRIGEAARMGPGWFPLAVGILLVLVGIATAVSGLTRGAAVERIRGVHLSTLFWILGSVVLFGLLLQPLGLVGALLVLILVSSKASHEFTWLGALLNAAFLIAFSLGVFIWGIDMLIPLWPAFVR
ncbi:tripartite tricarboxylate transporter TctB family protein [Ramlibacter rhizophilus]|uniref:Tripartite tricarboxylate transporter TctB family protein n=1 Tax=Ramlibacter rhizophilus TaxID=1781167 RepID=A0A4Z0C2A4_9BURK|nr:tripartite tricarboxylate transporter TctB family protein [Ramlibacter rhizophilus]TFZ04349.1 tripartite tricarboxylate transporter TctB family protein [Ramlibacter rhizophilus]